MPPLLLGEQEDGRLATQVLQVLPMFTTRALEFTLTSCGTKCVSAAFLFCIVMRHVRLTEDVGFLVVGNCSDGAAENRTLQELWRSTGATPSSSSGSSSNVTSMGGG